MLSVIIPSRNSQFLTKTIEDLLDNAEGEIEVIVNVDEKHPDKEVDDSRVTYLYPNQPIGMRMGINSCVDRARGQFIMKTDDHCSFGKGFDRILIENHAENNWVQIPRRYSLDAENWCINKTRPYRDYMYLCFPLKGKDHDWGMHGVEWFQRQRERTASEFDIDETMSMQGSCWFMTRDHYNNTLHGMSEDGYGQFSQESQEIGNKTWLSGGKMMVNKKTWYAHLHKGKTYGRMYHVPGFNEYTVKASNWSAKHWMNGDEPGMKYDMAWFINHFAPVPSWPDNWQEIWDQQLKEGWPA